MKRKNLYDHACDLTFDIMVFVGYSYNEPSSFKRLKKTIASFINRIRIARLDHEQAGDHYREAGRHLEKLLLCFQLSHAAGLLSQQGFRRFSRRINFIQQKLNRLMQAHH